MGKLINGINGPFLGNPTVFTWAPLLRDEGVKAGMKIAHTQMKINELKKQLE